MTDLVIRPAREADMPAIAAIYAPSVTDGTASFELVPPDAAEMARRWRALVEAGYPYLAAERAGAILGYAYAGPYRSRPGFRHTVENSVYIARQAQRQGVGRALLKALVAECGRLGFRQMVAVIGGSDNLASMRLHEAEGFALVGTLRNVGYKHERWLDSVLMQRPLGPGDREAPSR
jgi:L-amino acid N-acyltransferase YncA